VQSAECKVQPNSTYASFRSLIVWQKAQDLAARVAGLVAGLPPDRSSDVIANQILRSAGSVPANIAEGYGRYSEAAFRNHLSIARVSLCETESWLDLLHRTSKISQQDAEAVRKDCEEVARLITSSMRPLPAPRRQSR
jgi:four helix bundle protein